MKYTGSTGLTKIFQLIKSKFDGLSTVATSGSYSDLSDTPDTTEFISVTAEEYATLVSSNTDRDDVYYVITDESAVSADSILEELSTHTEDTTVHVTSTEKSTWNGKANSSHTQSASTISSGTFTGAVVAQTNTNYTTRQVRNVIMSTAEPTSSNGSNGDIWIQYSS